MQEQPGVNSDSNMIFISDSVDFEVLRGTNDQMN